MLRTIPKLCLSVVVGVLAIGIMHCQEQAPRDAHKQSNPTSAQQERGMKNKIYSGSIPEQLDIRLQRRETTPLPPGTWLRFQAINRGKNPRHNYRWILYEDGKLFFTAHSGDTSDWQTPFDIGWPATPSQNLARQRVDEVKKRLDEADFFAQSPYQVDNTVEDGGFYIVTARLDSREHEVIYEAIYPPLVEFLKTIAPPK